MSTETHRPAAVVVLAAGQGTRMKSRLPKILHPVGGRPMVGHAIAAARELDPAELAVVVRHERDLVAARVAELDPAALVVDQDEVPGTGRAVECAMEALGEIDGAVVVLAGDVPLLDGGTLGQMLATHHSEGDAVTILSTHVPDATGYGRIVRGADGQVEAIVEHKDATPAQREVREINTSTYVFDAATLRRGLASLDRANAQGEVYLTDVVAFARTQGGTVRAIVTDDAMSVEGVNDRVQLAALGAEMNRRTLEFWMREGVTVVDPATTWVDVDVELAPDVTVLPGTQLHGATKIGEGATIGPDTTLRDTEVHDGASVVRTHAELAVIGAGASVGPFSYLRPGTVLGPQGKIGGFVETKNARIGEGAKVPHLSYVGDAEIGEHTNIGAASVTVNYDGEHKHRTVIGAHARTGADNMFVAPVTVGDGAYTAAGSVIVRDVPAGALGVGRAEQRNIKGWVARKRPGTAAAEAAAAADALAGPAGPGAGATDHATTSDGDPDHAGPPDQERKAH
ncbi:bifunctional UDP-N-acetylglucosamine pyrophosphorylase/glucosamine-1-phosphate N-acetyltransferase [Myceligenerans xiligouense]|uniref:Bifunctional protein GlmU n=2 Tax=Myceligenerans xiligouense TaxID=253184 RepID=A0A3N4YNB8_9MICO|nr:bifunctional UDP-N-acetylglucosamine diphosphorylase/glucosamine-1-phosphate N-acetyltransferase GlmU [Myceligenerans xiligouense]RPF19960.1 bifunctional UDP-N-acetylglucosamine pyrophosphorylase/glucosamine-1-phosphate N-acetyltransferase [Myceligenerans xiligouense]